MREFWAEFSGPLSSCRGPQAALKCPYHRDRVSDPGLTSGVKSASAAQIDRFVGLDGPWPLRTCSNGTWSVNICETGWQWEPQWGAAVWVCADGLTRTLSHSSLGGP